MALATTCPQCMTSFRVVPDQLKLRRGLVRCGTCQHVFSGIDYLRYVDDARVRESGHVEEEPLDVDAIAATALLAPETILAEREAEAAQEGEDVAAASGDDAVAPPIRIERDEDPVADRTIDPAIDDAGVEAPPADAALAAANDTTDACAADTDERLEEDGEHPWLEGDDGLQSQGEGLPVDDVTEESARDAIETSEPDAAGSAEVAEASDSPEPAMAADAFDARGTTVHSDDDVEWVTVAPLAHEASAPAAEVSDTESAPPAQQADQANIGLRDVDSDESAIDYFSTRHRGVGFIDRHGALAVFVAGLLVVLLAVQWIVIERSAIAARLPAIAPAFAAVLAPFGLRIDPPRDLESLTIEAFELHAAATPELLEMSALLRNRAQYPVRWPSMQLTLTDTANRVLVRKVIAPEDYLAEGAASANDGVPPRGEWPLRMALEARDLQPAGYNVLLFYP